MKRLSKKKVIFLFSLFSLINLAACTPTASGYCYIDKSQSVVTVINDNETILQHGVKYCFDADGTPRD